jgi:hypothetical protein
MEVNGMINFEEGARLRELCEKASKEYDAEKLLDLVRQIDELLEKLEKKRRTPWVEDREQEASPARAAWSQRIVIGPSATNCLQFHS